MVKEGGRRTEEGGRRAEEGMGNRGWGVGCGVWDLSRVRVGCVYEGMGWVLAGGKVRRSAGLFLHHELQGHNEKIHTVDCAFFK